MDNWDADVLEMNLTNEVPAIVPICVAGVFETTPAHTHPSSTTDPVAKLTRPGVVILPFFATWAGEYDQGGRYQPFSDGVVKKLWTNSHDWDVHMFRIVVPSDDERPPSMTELWLHGHRIWTYMVQDENFLLFEVALDVDSEEAPPVMGLGENKEIDYFGECDPCRIVPLIEQTVQPDYATPGTVLFKGNVKLVYETLLGVSTLPVSSIPNRQAPPFYSTARPNEIWLQLEHRNQVPDSVAFDAALFTVAPIVFSSDVDVPKRVFAAWIADHLIEGDGDPVSVTGNFGFVGDLCAAIQRAGVEYTLVQGADVGWGGLVAETDAWCRDVVWFGHCIAPHASRAVMIHTPRTGPWLSVAGAMFTPDHVTAVFPQLFQEADSNKMQSSTLDSGGNLVVSPPVLESTAIIETLGGPPVPSHPPAPYGKLILGDDGAEFRPASKLRSWLDDQRVQPLLPIDTSFLRVGHADEVVSFARNDRATIMLFASPDKAIELLTTCANMKDVRSMRTHSEQKEIRPQLQLQTTILEMLGRFKVQDGRLSRLHHEFADKLDGVYQRLKIGLNLDRKDIQVVEIPVIFDPQPTRTHALLPNLVNILPVKEHLIFPKPWGPRIPSNLLTEVSNELSMPVFQCSELEYEYYWQKPYQKQEEILVALNWKEAIDVTSAAGGLPLGWSELPYRINEIPKGWHKLQCKLETIDLFEWYVCSVLMPLGFTIHFVDDWESCHLNVGEIHCATNAQREAPDVLPHNQWWLHYDTTTAVEAYTGCR